MLRKMLGGTAAIALLFAAGAAAAQDFSAQRISDGIREIASDEYQGRYPGTEGERMTLAWLQGQYEAMGLQPGGADGQWLQAFDIKRYTPERPAVVSWKGPDGQSHALTVGENVSLRAATNDGRANVTDAEVVFAGYGITAPERQWDDYGDIDVRGKVVMVLAGEPAGDVFNGQYTTNYNSGATKADEAFRRGAIGIITVSTDAIDSPAWQRAMQGVARTRNLSPGAADLEFSGTVPHSVAQEWGHAAGMDMSTVGAAMAAGTFKAMALPGITLSVDAAETFDALTTHNLMAKIEGSERPNEVIIYSAHWDHVGVDSEHPGADGDAIFNGAWDNASGTVGVVEMARAYSTSPRPERTVVFAHMAAEEMGLMGSYGYVANPVYPLATTVADINIDMLPLSASTHDVPIFGKGQNDLEDRLQVFAAAKGRYVSDDGQPEQNFYYRSDHYPFARAGVPAIMPWHGVDLVEGGKEAGWAEWRARFGADYHQASDEWREDLNFTSAVENLGLMYELGMSLANSSDWPQWKPTSEFGQVRARTDAERQ